MPNDNLIVTVKPESLVTVTSNLNNPINSLVTVKPNSPVTVTSNFDFLVKATSNLNSQIYLESLDNVGDIDMTLNGKHEGSVLVYRTSTNKWTASAPLDAQNIDAGEF